MAQKKSDDDAAPKQPEQKTKKVYVSQTDVPRYPIQDALRVARAIADQYGKQPASPLDIAVALDMKPTTGPFRYLCGSALAYGITDGGPRATQIGLTDLGRRIVAPTEEGDDQKAMREALLQPRVVGEFLRRYNTSKLPTEKIGGNVLETMGVPSDATERTLDLIVSGARELGLLREIKGDEYVQLDGAITGGTAALPPDDPAEDETPTRQRRRTRRQRSRRRAFSLPLWPRATSRPTGACSLLTARTRRSWSN
jgi:hypothetical protein